MMLRTCKRVCVFFFRKMCVISFDFSIVFSTITTTIFLACFSSLAAVSGNARKVLSFFASKKEKFSKKSSYDNKLSIVFATLFSCTKIIQKRFFDLPRNIDKRLARTLALCSRLVETVA
uniref:(northern house mosquito) hypothetical protein n=1 Tax=Culex pipiens TaxID=7175 RepID=A0A8D8GPH4_CULPI